MIKRKETYPQMKNISREEEKLTKEAQTKKSLLVISSIDQNF